MTWYHQLKKSREGRMFPMVLTSTALHKIATLVVKGRSNNWCPFYLIKPPIVQHEKRQRSWKGQGFLLVQQLQQRLNHKAFLAYLLSARILTSIICFLITLWVSLGLKQTKLAHHVQSKPELDCWTEMECQNLMSKG